MRRYYHVNLFVVSCLFILLPSTAFLTPSPPWLSNIKKRSSVSGGNGIIKSTTTTTTTTTTPLLTPPAGRPLGISSYRPSDKYNENHKNYYFDNGYRKVTAKTTNDRSVVINDYLQLIRPITILQAVAAFVAGRLVVNSYHSFNSNVSMWTDIAASISIYLSYGSGMAVNDCTDSTIDAMHPDKCHRPIASGRVTAKEGWFLVSAMSVLSLILAIMGVNAKFGLWTLSNIAIQTLYALGLQKVFLIKNLIVGWLCLSPLIGSTLVESSSGSFLLPLLQQHQGQQQQQLNTAMIINNKLWHMAMLWLPVGVAREILKDAQDVDIDRGQKSTIPLVLGVKTSQWISMIMIFTAATVQMVIPTFRQMFVSYPIPWFIIGWTISTALCIKACMQPLDLQQTSVKKSIYSMLLGLILGLMAQK